jgi:putative ABC transport system permease protein
MMIGQITDSMLGHLQIHRKGYVASIDNLPLNLNLPAQAYGKIAARLAADPRVDAFSPRIKFGGMFSNFVETTNIRLNGIDPEKELQTVPLLTARIAEGETALRRGELWVPVLLAKGLKVKLGDVVVIVATNADGSVNGKQFTVSAILESVTGPGGRDGYLHIDDAADILRMDEAEISEVVVRLKQFDRLDEARQHLIRETADTVDKQGRPMLEVHSWEQLSPFFNIASMIDVMTFFIKIMLVAIVLISIKNVMIMAVYERIREIGTIAAIGTPPGRIRTLFIMEGFCLGVIGAVIGNLIGIGLVVVLNLIGIEFDFGQQKGLLLTATLDPMDVLVVSAIVIAVAVAASLQPAFKASRMEPIQALRHV